MAARGGVRTGRLERSIMAVTIDLVENQQRRQEREAEVNAFERDEEARLVVSGEVGNEVGWGYQDVKFDITFLHAPDRRTNALKTPHFTFGSEMLTPTPVMLSVHVMSWIKGPAGEYIGARVAVGAFQPGATALIAYRARLHLTFTGYAYANISSGGTDV